MISEREQYKILCLLKHPFTTALAAVELVAIFGADAVLRRLGR